MMSQATPKIGNKRDRLPISACKFSSYSISKKKPTELNRAMSTDWQANHKLLEPALCCRRVVTGCFLLFGLPVHHQSAVHHLYHNAYKGQHNRTVVATGYRVPSTAAQPHQQRSHFGTQRNFSARFSLVHPYHQHRWKKTKNKDKENLD